MHGLIRQARVAAGMSQVQLAERLGVSQSAIAHLESARANPTLATLERVIDATGHSLELALAPRAPGPDESLIAAHMRLSPLERVRTHDRASRQLGSLIGRVGREQR